MDAGVWLDGMIWLSGEWKPWSEKGRDGGFFDCFGRIGKKAGRRCICGIFLQFCALEVNDFEATWRKKTSEPCFVVHDSDDSDSPISLFFIPRRRGLLLVYGGRISAVFALEGQVVVAVVGSKLGGSSRSHGRHGSIGHGCTGCGVHAFYLPGSDAVEPAVLPLAGVNVERNGQFFVHLDVELFYLVVAKDFKAHFAWILSVVFYYKFLNFPFVSCFGNSSSGREYGDNFSCKFHDFID